VHYQDETPCHGNLQRLMPESGSTPLACTSTPIRNELTTIVRLIYLQMRCTQSAPLHRCLRTCGSWVQRQQENQHKLAVNWLEKTIHTNFTT
jgi:hypothetical protein